MAVINLYDNLADEPTFGAQHRHFFAKAGLGPRILACQAGSPLRWKEGASKNITISALFKWWAHIPWWLVRSKLKYAWVWQLMPSFHNKPCARTALVLELGGFNQFGANALWQ
jgi:hypothetical protein